MAVAPSIDGNSEGGCGSQFFLTLADNIEYLDGKHAVFGHVVEGLDTLDKLNDVFVDQDCRPLKDVRIRHVVVLDDPFPDPPGLVVPDSPPVKPTDNSTRIAEDEDPLETLPEEEEERIRREKAAAASALTLEMVGDLPFANVRPPENVLFVCKLNPVTRDEDLELIFSRFGTIMSCQVIRDKKTGDSLQYAFIEFDKREEAEQAYFKMQNVLVDDRRIWVDFPSRKPMDLGQMTSNEGPSTQEMVEAVLLDVMIWSRHGDIEKKKKATVAIRNTEWFSMCREAAHVEGVGKETRGEDAPGLGVLEEARTEMGIDEIEGVDATRITDVTMTTGAGIDEGTPIRAFLVCCAVCIYVYHRFFPNRP
ncbi:Peptidyl-prolyl cis-trans isomerase-like 4 [Marasmius tenuissimus]|uniref:Peptidyl-prolyl cis-trans isomerase n=1 Tax=Marasmius tenuissimus TaxID=585030 RepID=A0ABR3A8D5_9AGAR